MVNCSGSYFQGQAYNEMMESFAKASTKCLEELSILLRNQGFIVHPGETRDIDVEHDGSIHDGSMLTN